MIYCGSYWALSLLPVALYGCLSCISMWGFVWGLHGALGASSRYILCELLM
ncbi:hypothetical protein MARVELLAND_55 [Bacillus phage vB_BspM_MarvelLand]|nr:hypothetical protein MARVELLAND_55 [Bacillus phage vB_BspM_MarvelLand]